MDMGEQNSYNYAYTKNCTCICFISVAMDPLGWLTLSNGTDLINDLIKSMQRY